jgi:Rrf2 family iron-sulfur cluster assembly transcriptional regulator
VRAVVNLAAAANNEPISISQIAKKEQLSPEFLEQIFFRLKKAGLIRSIRGPKGGFVLNHKPAEISVKTILEAVGEPLFPAPCADHGTKETCPRQETCLISPIWQDFYALILQHLSGISLKDILDNAKSPAASSSVR